MRSAYYQFDARSPHPQTPAPPMVVGADLNATPPYLLVKPSPNDKNGQPMQRLSQIVVACDDGSLVDKVADWMGLLPTVKTPVTLEQADQPVKVVLPELKPDMDYTFHVAVDA